MNLLERLGSYGLTVRAVRNWEENTNGGKDRVATYGILNHFDANVGTPHISHYLYDNRWGGILYHMVIRRDGTVDLLSQRYVWHAGMGDAWVLYDLKDGGPPRQGVNEDTNGNPYFFSISINYHPDYEGVIPGAQYDALVKANAAVADHYGLGKNQIADHATWTDRKRDIDEIDWPHFREAVAMARQSRGGEDDMQFLIDTLKGLDTGFFQALQAKTGTPAGDPAYWGGNQASEAEWRAAAPAFMAAILRAAAQPADSGGPSPADVRKIISDAIING